MSTWVIISWVFVALLTGVNIFAFMKLKSMSEQMLKTAFPGAKNMNEALAKMQQMMSGFQGGAGKGGRSPFGGPALGGGSDAQLKAAMDMLKNAQKRR